MHWVHSTMHKLRSEKAFSESHCLDVLADYVAADAELLCFDEFAITNVADAVILSQLFYNLGERYVGVVCTTNRPPEDLYKEGLHRDLYLPTLVDFLRQHFLVVKVDNGHDYRENIFQAAGGSALENTMFFSGEDPDAALAKGLKEEGLPVFSPAVVRLPWNRTLKV